MLNKNAASMTIGTSMGQEICLILGQVSHKLLYWKKNLPKDICGPGGDGQGDGVPKAGLQQAAADSQGSRTCVCANTQPGQGGTRRGGRMN